MNKYDWSTALPSLFKFQKTKAQQRAYVFQVITQKNLLISSLCTKRKRKKGVHTLLLRWLHNMLDADRSIKMIAAVGR
jgi:hypothetical protein